MKTHPLIFMALGLLSLALPLSAHAQTAPASGAQSSKPAAPGAPSKDEAAKAAPQKALGPKKAALPATLALKREYPKDKAGKGQSATPLSLKGAIGRALKRSPELTIARLKTHESEKRLEAERRNILPKFTLSASLLRWDSALALDLGSPTITTVPDDCPVGCLTFLGELFGSFDMGNIRDQYTQQYTVQVAQPITGAFAILQMIKARKVDVKVAKLEEDLNRKKIRFKTVQAYIQVLQAREYLAITEKSIALLKSHLKRAMLFYKAEVLSKSEILKLNTALGNALQNRLQAKTGVDLAMALLKMHMGESGSSAYSLTERFPAPQKMLSITEKEAYKIMEKNRPELKQLKKQAEMIRLSHKASRIALLPSANVIAQYQHNEGMGSMQPKNSWFVGLSVSWTWEWNKKHLESDLVLSKLKQLEAATKQARLGLRLGVKQHLLKVRTAWNQIAIAKIALKEAEESLRLEQLRFGAQMKTAVSLLDAQTRLDGAKTSLNNSIYEYYKSVASLMEAMGVTSLKRSTISW